MRLTMPNRSNVLARQPVDPGHRHHVAGGQLAEHPVKLAPVGPRTRHLLAVDVSAGASGGAKLLKLRGKGLPHGADAGIADEASVRAICRASWSMPPAVLRATNNSALSRCRVRATIIATAGPRHNR
jgi:hypothetical protein